MLTIKDKSIDADDGEAIWNGSDLDIDYKLYEGFHLVG